MLSSSAAELGAETSVTKAQSFVMQEELRPSTRTLEKTSRKHRCSTPVTARKVTGQRCVPKAKTGNSHVQLNQVERWRREIRATFASERHRGAKAAEIHQLPHHARPPNVGVVESAQGSQSKKAPDVKGTGQNDDETFARELDKNIPINIDAIPLGDINISMWSTSPNMDADADVVDILRATSLTDHDVLRLKESKKTSTDRACRPKKEIDVDIDDILNATYLTDEDFLKESKRKSKVTQVRQKNYVADTIMATEPTDEDKKLKRSNVPCNSKQINDELQSDIDEIFANMS